jgi:hypothetical protein
VVLSFAMRETERRFQDGLLLGLLMWRDLLA